jgi:hypothetical protein
MSLELTGLCSTPLRQPVYASTVAPQSDPSVLNRLGLGALLLGLLPG